MSLLFSRGKIFRAGTLLLGVALLFSSATSAFARIVDEVSIRSRKSGYEIRIDLSLPMRHLNHSPKQEGDILVIQLRPISSPGPENMDQMVELGKREALTWDREVPIPLKELNYDGGTPGRPTITAQFTKAVRFDVRSSADLRNLFITVRTGSEKRAEAKPESIDPGMPLPDTSSAKPKIAQLMDEANQAMIAENYYRAVQLYTKILQEPENVLAQDAQELLGLARERNGQLAHAKAEYDKYLRLYPKGPGATRVRQRLDGLLTRTALPKEKLRKVNGMPEGEVWQSQIFGSFSQFYNRDVTDPDNSDTLVNRSDLASDLDFNARFRSKDYEIRSQFVGGNTVFFEKTGSGSETRVNTFTVEGTDKRRGLYARVGRQTQSTGGILGRFDGGVLSYDITPQVKINGVFGFPVITTTDDPVNSDRHFLGANFDLGTFWDYWDFNVFFINQEVDGITDRRAIGGEARFFKPQYSFFSFLDYDISYNQLNIFLFNGNLNLPSKTLLNLVLDYRKSPLLTTSNALIGQGTENVSELLNTFSEDQVRKLAEERTSESRTLTFGVTQELSENYQVTGEFTVSNLSGTMASGGVPASPGTGNEYFYSLQLMASNLMLENDVNLLELRFGDTFNADTYTLNLNSRFPINNKFRFNPRLQIDFRDNKTNDDNRWRIRPQVRMEYRLKRWLRLELEGGMDWTNETVLGQDQQTRGYFFFAGYRIEF